MLSHYLLMNEVMTESIWPKVPCGAVKDACQSCHLTDVTQAALRSLGCSEVQ